VEWDCRCVMLAKARKAGQIIAVDVDVVNEAALQKAVVLGATVCTHVVNVTGGMDQEGNYSHRPEALTIDGHGADVT
jgi:hypothetical protein